MALDPVELGNIVRDFVVGKTLPLEERLAAVEGRLAELEGRVLKIEVGKGK